MAVKEAQINGRGPSGLLQILIIDHNGNRRRETFIGRDPPLEQLQRIVGGYIEIVPHGFKLDGLPAIMYVNEDGLSKQLPYNQSATSLCGGIHHIVGTVALVPVRRKGR